MSIKINQSSTESLPPLTLTFEGQDAWVVYQMITTNHVVDHRQAFLRLNGALRRALDYECIDLRGRIAAGSLACIRAEQ